MKQFFAILAIGVVLIAGYVFYVHWSRTRALESGDVVEINQPVKATEQAPAPPPAVEMAKTEPVPGPAKPAVPTPAATQPAPQQATNAAPTTKPAAPAPTPAPQQAKPAAPPPAPAQPAKAAPVPSPSQPAPQELALNGNGPLQLHPSKPSAAIPPDGVFTDKGRFQLYRQGDITWRMNTQTGKACVFLATEAQWSKSVVYENGCHGR